MLIPQRIRYYTTVGDNNTKAQAFYNNIWVKPFNGIIPVFEQIIPSYTTVGGTKDYYGQNPLSIFTNLAKPFIRYTFTAETSSLNSIKNITHRIYKIDYDTFKNFQPNQPTTQIDREITTSNQSSTPNSITTERSRRVLGRNKKIDFIRAYNQPLKESDAKLLQPLLETPYATFTADTTTITTNTYDFYPHQYVKNLGSFKEELFEDKSQYFIETEFEFQIDKGLPYDTYSSYVDGKLVEGRWDNKVNFTTKDPKHIIITGDFKGLSVQGAYFTYFTVPDKPKLEYPYVEGVLSTFSPEFFWSEAENADEYLIQIVYNTGDTLFSGTVFNYPISKTENNRHFAESKTKTTNTEFSSHKIIRSASVQLKGNSSDFLYRVGNVKYIENIFGIRQFVVTFSDVKSAKTQTDFVRTFVRVQSDSPYAPEIAEYTTPASLLSENPLSEYMLSGYVSGSIVTGATVQLIFPNSSFITTTTDLTGYFEFTQIEEGAYNIITNYRGYAQDYKGIYISGDTSLQIELQVRWDNTYDQWFLKENDIIKF